MNISDELVQAWAVKDWDKVTSIAEGVLDSTPDISYDGRMNYLGLITLSHAMKAKQITSRLTVLSAKYEVTPAELEQIRYEVEAVMRNMEKLNG